MYRHDSLSFTILAALFGLYTITNAQILDSPLPENFVRRSQVAATILGNYVYIEGGHIAQLQPPSGKIDPNQPVNIVNSTLSIDMSHSWSSSNVSIRTIPKPPQMQDRSVPSIWTDAARGEYYLWGGASQAGSKSKLGVEKDKTYKFTTDGSGGGSWSLDDSVPSDKQTPRLLRTQHAAYASTPRSAFAIGGIATSFGDVSMANNGNPGIQRQAVPGMIEFDFDSRQFTNLTDAPIAGSSIIGAQAEYIPNFGESNGLVIVLGGWQARLDDGGVYNINLPTFDFHNLTFFDPATKQKYWQATSGDVPPSPRMQFCSAGRVTADGKGYDLFIHGGLKQQGSRQTHLDAYILSLPGFFWTRVPQGQGGHTAVVESRSYHVCLPVGKRQILSIGGNRDGSDKWTPADSAPQGLLLFDMTSMQWKYDFDSEDEAYESAGVIREWYRRG
ncbi:hypothetical protein QBC44DRAFT_231332 [Cladorrhinum sp. PSN332]|nr:hypothetical protein QBC44DRAFT_231332 [Cladorrhinum sp. PSN332]